MNNVLSPEELNRYARHISLSEMGVEGQEKLKAARVLIIGAGGLGCPVLLYLAAAGVGHIGIVDGDVVDVSNLQRQVLYTMEDIGQSKAIVAKKRLEALNPYINITVYPFILTKENALEIIKKYEIIVDGTDNFPARYLIDDACVLTNKINIYASVHRFEGQVAVFNIPNADGTRGATYRDLFPTPPTLGTVLNCAEEGIIGVLPGIIGSLQANEVIKIITGIGEPLAGKIALFDAANFTIRVIKLKKTTNAVITELIDYDYFCNQNHLPVINTITVHQLQQMMQDSIDFQLIDVRESNEHAQFNLGGILIPLPILLQKQELIPKDKSVMFYCQSGNRSIAAIQDLTKQGNHSAMHFYTLEGGVNAWRNAFIREE